MTKFLHLLLISVAFASVAFAQQINFAGLSQCTLQDVRGMSSDGEPDAYSITVPSTSFSVMMAPTRESDRSFMTVHSEADYTFEGGYGAASSNEFFHRIDKPGFAWLSPADGTASFLIYEFNELEAKEAWVVYSADCVRSNR